MKKIYVIAIYALASIVLHAAGLAGAGLVGMSWQQEQAAGAAPANLPEGPQQEYVMLHLTAVVAEAAPVEAAPAETAPAETAPAEAAPAETAAADPVMPATPAVTSSPGPPETELPRVDRTFSVTPPDPRPARAPSAQAKPARPAAAQPRGKMSARTGGTPAFPGAGGQSMQRHAAVTNAPKPAYPPAARRQKLEGTVVVRIAVSAAGRAEGVWVEKSSGHAILDEAALGAARSTRFSPAQRNGTATADQVRRPYTFRLK